MSDQIPAAQSVPAPAKSGGSRATTIVIVVIVVLCLICVGCCVISIAAPGFLLNLLGPAIGNVFSNIIETI